MSQDASGGVAGALGCNFACVGGALAAQSIVDLAVRPGAPAHRARAELVVRLRRRAAPLRSIRASGETSDDGAHWTQRGAALDPTVTVTTIDVAASDPARLYVSGTRGFGAARTASLFVSTDGGETWTERPVPFDPGDRGQHLHRRGRPERGRHGVRAVERRVAAARDPRRGAIVPGPAHAHGADAGLRDRARRQQDLRGERRGRALRRGDREHAVRVRAGTAGAETSRFARSLRFTCSASRRAGRSSGRARTRRAASPWACRRTTGASLHRDCSSTVWRAHRVRPERAGALRVRCGRERLAVRRSGVPGGVHDARRLRGRRGRRRGRQRGRQARTRAVGAPGLTSDASTDELRTPAPSCGCSVVPATVRPRSEP